MIGTQPVLLMLWKVCIKLLDQIACLERKIKLSLNGQGDESAFKNVIKKLTYCIVPACSQEQVILKCSQTQQQDWSYNEEENISNFPSRLKNKALLFQNKNNSMCGQSGTSPCVDKPLGWDFQRKLRELRSQNLNEIQWEWGSLTPFSPFENAGLNFWLKVEHTHSKVHLWHGLVQRSLQSVSEHFESPGAWFSEG